MFTDTPLVDPLPQTTSLIGTYVQVSAGAVIGAPPRYGFGGPASGAPPSAAGGTTGGADDVVEGDGAGAAGVADPDGEAAASADGLAVPQAFAPSAQRASAKDASESESEVEMENRRPREVGASTRVNALTQPKASGKAGRAPVPP
jgi:hypothetical protein